MLAGTKTAAHINSILSTVFPSVYDKTAFLDATDMIFSGQP
jgi:hypothetical protein